jgi:hypothetical protein
MAPKPGVEPGTFGLTVRRYYQLSYLGTDTTKLVQSDRNRTCVSSGLDRYQSLADPRMHCETTSIEILVETARIRTGEAEATDLQSAPFAHLGTPPEQQCGERTGIRTLGTVLTIH